MKEKLLVLDDEWLILTSLEHLFEDDYEVFTTTEGEVALRLARDHDFALILCDERMPSLSGHEFLRRVRDVSRATRIMMSGCADMSALTDAVNGGQIFAYIEKPWEPMELRSQVSAAVAHFKVVRDVEQERELLRALMENIPDLIYFKDCQSRFTRVNQAYARNLGVADSAECIGKSSTDYFESKDVFRWGQLEEEMLRSGRADADRIEQLQNPGGGLTWWSTTKVPMFDRSGRVSGIAGISRDITALKNTEEMLREQSERNRMTIETASDAIIGLDPDGTITAWNPSAELIFGWTGAEALGRHWHEIIIAPADRDAHVQGVEHFLAGQRARANQNIDMLAVDRNGREFPVEATIWPIRVGAAASFNAFLRDISERRRAEEARTKETGLVQLLQSVTVAANESSTIEDSAQTCLERICRYTGWPVGHVYLRAGSSPEKMISRWFWDVEEDDVFTAFRETSDGCRFAPGTGLPGSVLASGRPQWIVNLADEEPLSERACAAGLAGLQSGFGIPILVDGKVMGVLEFFSLKTVPPDEAFLHITEHIGSQLGQVIIRQRVEEDLRNAKAAAEAASQAKSEFLSTVSHEMRTPMNAILGMADVLSESPLNEEQREYVRLFQRAGARLLDLVNDILDLAKVESGHVELESIDFDLGALLKKIMDMMATVAISRGLKLTLDVLPGVPLALVGDPKCLQQILINLIGNALKFTEEGSVTVRVGREPALKAGGVMRGLRFNVVDTGIGIPAGKTEMIFERFTQADSSTARKYGGTGLGLAISKGLAELMGGRIGCTSEVGRGSTFFVVAEFGIRKDGAVAQSEELAGIPTSPAVVAGERMPRILIVEDCEDNLAVMNAYLKDCRFVLDFAENGQVAVDKVVSGKPDLVLMDMQMPVMDGLEATRAIRQWESKTRGRSIPILALTANVVAEGAARTFAAGCNEHLTKPIKKAALLDAISRHVGKIRVTLPEGVEDLISTYLANIRRRMDEILASGESKHWETARRLGHEFKGSGECYGFPEITRAGAAVEIAANAADDNEIRAQILALASYLDRVEIVA